VGRGTRAVSFIDELTEILAEAEGVTPEEIEQGAEELDLAPPEEATVLKE
jgi:hypothetical protein